jgi:hypothetical protein
LFVYSGETICTLFFKHIFHLQMAIGHPGVLGVTLPEMILNQELGHATIQPRPMEDVFAHLEKTQQLNGLMSLMWKLKPGLVLLQNVLKVVCNLLQKKKHRFSVFVFSKCPMVLSVSSGGNNLYLVFQAHLSFADGNWSPWSPWSNATSFLCLYRKIFDILVPSCFSQL